MVVARTNSEQAEVERAVYTAVVEELRRPGIKVEDKNER